MHHVKGTNALCTGEINLKQKPGLNCKFLCYLFDLYSFKFSSILFVKYHLNILQYILLLNLSFKLNFKFKTFHFSTSKICYNPSNAEATLVQSTRMQSYLKHVNPVKLVFIGKLSLSTLRWVPMGQSFTHFSVFLHHIVLVNFFTSSISVKGDFLKPQEGL